MALDTYANLKTSIANFLARDDLTSEIDDFIDLTEADFNRRLRIRDMETSLAFTIDTEQESLHYNLCLLFIKLRHKDLARLVDQEHILLKVLSLDLVLLQILHTVQL